MRRILLSGSILLAIGAFLFVTTGADSPKSSNPTYRIELDNAFGLVNGADFKVAGVPAGSISKIDLNQRTLRAIVTVTITKPGLSTFHADATCDSQPQSLIGEYFISCDPGTRGPVLKPGAMIPVTHTRSTIPADLLNDIMRMPQRERLPLIINSLGAGVAGRSGDLQAAIRRAVPALTETDNLLNLLANDSRTIQSLNVSANQVITALADNSGAVQRFIEFANRAGQATAVQQANLQASLHRLPPFLAQLRPAMAQLGAATATNLPVLQNLNASAANLSRLFRDLPGFAGASKPALRALGKASVTGRSALVAAKPTITLLNGFARHAPELAQNLAIVLPRLDNRKYATEPNKRSPGGKGFTGLEALLQFVFNSSGAINYYGPYGHLLAVDGFLSQMCSPYATPATVAAGLKQYGAVYRSCYAFLGPNQPGVNETDPSNPSACVPDPGGSMPGKPGPATTACRLSAASDAKAARAPARRGRKARAVASKTPVATTTTGAGGGGPATGPQAGGVGSTLHQVGQTVSQVLSLLGGSGAGSSSTGAGAGAGGGSGAGSAGSATQRLLNYLLAP
jgi:virulence factor Mce-like protein